MANQNNRPSKKEQRNNDKKNSPRPGHVPITTVDDPENDVFDDEVFDDDSVIAKPPKKDEENFEKPW